MADVAPEEPEKFCASEKDDVVDDRGFAAVGRVNQAGSMLSGRLCRPSSSKRGRRM